MEQFLTFVFIAWITVLLNIPLGVWRSTLKKFSIPWIIAVHLSIPLIVIFRIHAGLHLGYIPAVILMAIIGQRMGAKILSKTKVVIQEPVE